MDDDDGVTIPAHAVRMQKARLELMSMEARWLEMGLLHTEVISVMAHRVADLSDGTARAERKHSGNGGG